MDVTYDPEDGSEPQKWQFDPDDVRRSEATAIERAFGASWEEWISLLRVRHAKARTVLLWHLLRQQHPKLSFQDTPDFKMRQVRVEMGSDELRAVYDQISRTKMNDDIREAFEAAYARDYQDALAREGKALTGEIEPAPKAN